MTAEPLFIPILRKLDSLAGKNHRMTISTRAVSSFGIIQSSLLYLIGDYLDKCGIGQCDGATTIRDMIETHINDHACDGLTQWREDSTSVSMSANHEHTVNFVQHVQKFGRDVGIHSKFGTEYMSNLPAEVSNSLTNHLMNSRTGGSGHIIHHYGDSHPDSGEQGRLANEDIDGIGEYSPISKHGKCNGREDHPVDDCLIRMTKSELDVEMSSYFEQTRAKLDMSNNREFLSDRTGIPVGETGSARTTEPSDRVPRMVMNRVDIANNDWGPLRKEMNDGYVACADADSRLQLGADGIDSCSLCDIVNTRLENVQQHIGWPELKDKSSRCELTNLLQRVKQMEDFLCAVEKDDPELAKKYFPTIRNITSMARPSSLDHHRSSPTNRNEINPAQSVPKAVDNDISKKRRKSRKDVTTLRARRRRKNESQLSDDHVNTTGLKLVDSDSVNSDADSKRQEIEKRIIQLRDRLISQSSRDSAQ